MLEVLAPAVLLAGLGAAWAQSGRDWPMGFVTGLAMGVATPALVFTALMGAALPPEALGRAALAAAAGFGLLTLVFWGLCGLLGLDRRSLVVPLTFGNTGNLGFPIVFFAFGEAGLALAVVIFAVGMVWQFTFGLWLMAGGGLRPMLREPVLWACLGGGLFLAMGWQTPGWLTDTLVLTGQMAIPLMLLTLGVAVAGLRPARLPRAAGLALLRLAVCLAVAVPVGVLLLDDPLARAVLILQLSMPVAVTAYLMAQRLGGDGEAVAGLVLASTLLALPVLPVLLALLL